MVSHSTFPFFKTLYIIKGENMKKKILDLLDKILMMGIMLGVLIFILYPFISVFKTSLIDNGSIDLSYFSFVKTEYYLIKNSITTGIYTTMLSTVFSIMIAVYFYISNNRVKKLIMGILMLTIISPPFVTSLSYIRLFGRRGFITYKLLGLSISPYGQLGIVLMQSLGFTSMNAMLLIGYLNQLDKTLIESARSLGARTTDIIKDIILPLMGSAITVVMLLSFIRSLADFSTPRIIGGAFNVLATEAYLSVIAKGNIRRAATISVILFIPAIIVFILYMTKFQTISMSQHGTSSGEGVSIKREGFLYNFMKIGAIFFLVWISIQYIAIIMSAFTDMNKGEIYFTLDHFREGKISIMSTFPRTIFVAFIAGIFSSIIGLLLEYYGFIRNYKSMKIIDFIATMPYIVPGTFFGIGYILAFNKKPLELTGTILIVILNVIFRQLPFASKVGYSALTQINRDIINSAKDLGGHNIYVIKDLIIPLSKSGLYIAFVNGFTSTMTTIGSIIFLIYPKQKLATMVMFDVIESGKYGVGSVIAFLIILVCLIVNGLYYVLLSRREKNIDVS